MKTWKNKMTEYQWIDDCFRVEESRLKTWRSFNKDGGAIVTSLTEELCINVTRFYLKGKQDGSFANESTVKYEGTVSGKL